MLPLAKAPPQLALVLMLAARVSGATRLYPELNRPADNPRQQQAWTKVPTSLAGSAERPCLFAAYRGSLNSPAALDAYNATGLGTVVWPQCVAAHTRSARARALRRRALGNRGVHATATAFARLLAHRRLCALGTLRMHAGHATPRHARHARRPRSPVPKPPRPCPRAHAGHGMGMASRPRAGLGAAAVHKVPCALRPRPRSDPRQPRDARPMARRHLELCSRRHGHVLADPADRRLRGASPPGCFLLCLPCPSPAMPAMPARPRLPLPRTPHMVQTPCAHRGT